MRAGVWKRVWTAGRTERVRRYWCNGTGRLLCLQDATWHDLREWDSQPGRWEWDAERTPQSLTIPEVL